MNIALLDVQYRSGVAFAGCILTDAWDSANIAFSTVKTVSAAEEYLPGDFYKRELPALLAVLESLPQLPDIIVVDGYVWLSADRRPGLGARLFDALGGRIPVVGIAKTPFAGSDFAKLVHRASSKRPLYVTAAGMDEALAANNVQTMKGDSRLPLLLKAVDRLARQAALL